MKIRDFEIDACIFDLDGTLLDSCSIWADVDYNFFKKRGMEVPKDYGKKISTMGLDEAAKYTKSRFNLQEDEDEIVFEWLSAVKKEYAEVVSLKPHAKEYLEYLKKNNIPLVVATANTRECYEPCLKRLGIYDDFEFVFDVKGIVGGKRNPDIFLNASYQLGIDPSKIMVFEDTLLALETAESVGFRTCAIYEKTCKDEEIKKLFADVYIDDFESLLKFY